MPRPIGYGYDSDLLRALFGTEEHAPFDIADELHGMLALQVDRPEWGFLRNEFYFISRSLNRLAVAARFSYTGIVNRSPRNLIVITGVQVPSGVANVIYRRGRLPDANLEASIASEAPAIPIDIRVPGTPDASLAAREITGDSIGNVGSTAFGFTISGQNYPQGMLPIVAILGPNSYLIAEGTVVNTIAQGVFFGYQKTLFKGDRA